MPMMIITMTIIIMMMTRVTVAMAVVKAAAARPPGAAKTWRTATIAQKTYFPTYFMTLNRYLAESTISLGGGGGVPASHQQVAW